MGSLSRRICTCAVLVVAALGLVPQAGFAQRDALVDERESEGRARFEAGRAAFAAGHFEDALADFQRAYELTHRPVLLFNIASAADRLRRDELALRSFEAYLEALPEAENRDEVEGRMRVLRAQRAVPAPALRPSAKESDPPREAPRVDEPRAFPRWIAPVAGGALAAAGGVLLGLGIRDKHQVEDAPRDTLWADVRSANDHAPVRIGVGGALIGVGVVTLVTGLAWPRARAVTPALASDGRSVALGASGRF